MQTTPTPQSITVKLAIMLALVLVELVLNSFVQGSFSMSSQSLFYVNFYFLPIQLVVTCCLFIMMLILMWQTFPLRYGLVGRLFSEFRGTFAIVVAFVALTAAERGYKLAIVVVQQDAYTEQALFTDTAYQALYYIRYIAYPVFYATLLRFALTIIDPIFYKPSKWLN